MNVAVQLCEKFIGDRLLNKLSGNYSNSSIVWQTLDMTPLLKDTITICRFRDELRFCSELFSPTITDVGVCYTFNALNNIDLVSDE